MLNFSVSFFLCNLVLIVLTGLLLLFKKLLRNHISPRIQYRLWIFLFVSLAIPLLPTDLSRFSPGNLLHFGGLTDNSMAYSADATSVTSLRIPEDFAVSVTERAFPGASRFFLCLWATGMIAVVLFFLRSWLYFSRIRRSSLPLENLQVQKIFRKCKKETDIRYTVRIHTTPFLKSPVTSGILMPTIYLPLHMISEYPEEDLRHMLLHELMHCRQKDAVMNLLACAAEIVYWFNPLIWISVRKMRLEQEIACDSAVLDLLKETEYARYGHTLINHAEKCRLSPFPFFSGIGGNIRQIRTRIRNIAGYHRETRRQKRIGILSCTLTLLLFLGSAPALSVRASDDYYDFDPAGKQIVSLDLSELFQEYNGSFVLYDSRENVWQIYNSDAARERISPCSTYKIYAALHGLENGIITPQNSKMSWDGTDYPFDVWETDQDLTSALQNSVNWYFQNIDTRLGIHSIREFLRKIHYGNQTAGNDPKLYWTDQSLKISPIEQVEFLRKLHDHQLPFSAENMEAVKKSLCLGQTAEGSFYGKTGTGQVNGQNVNGWFIGYLETSRNVYYFATNIQNSSDADGNRAAEITAEILSLLL